MGMLNLIVEMGSAMKNLCRKNTSRNFTINTLEETRSGMKTLVREDTLTPDAQNLRQHKCPAADNFYMILCF